MSNAAMQEVDNVTEYFQIKKTLKTLRADLKDLQVQHPKYEEVQKLAKKVKELRDEMNEEESLKALKEKISEQKERQDLLKELIRISLIENAEEAVKKEGRALKLIYVLKEIKDENDK